MGGFAVLDNHLHVLVRLDPDLVADWSDEELACRWGRLSPLRDQARILLTEDARPCRGGRNAAGFGRA
jgi:hypothetical protein